MRSGRLSVKGEAGIRMNAVRRFRWAIPLIAALMSAVLAGCQGEPEVVYVDREVIREVPVEREVVVTATPAPPPVPTVQPLVAEMNSVTIQGDELYVNSDKGRKKIEITDSGSLVNHLAASGAVDENALRRYEQEGVLRISLEDLANEIWELTYAESYEDLNERFGFDKEDVTYLVAFVEALEEPPVAEATMQPTPVVEPTATSRASEDYYVVIRESISAGGGPIGTIVCYADFPSLNIYAAKTGGATLSFSNHEFLMDYFLKEGVITNEQREDYSRGLKVTASYDDVSVAIYKLLQIKGYDGMAKDLSLFEAEIEELLYHFDESLLVSDDSSDYPMYNDSYVVISDGSLETVVTDASGNTTRVKIGTVDAGEFLDYLLSQGKITVEQRNEYGDTHRLKLSLEDAREAADFFDWAYSSDEGLYIGIDKEDVNYIRDELLPLFSFGD